MNISIEKIKHQQNWLADFSDPVRIFTVIVVAEIVVIVYSLSFLSFDFEYFNRLAIISLLAQFIAITVIVLLSKLKGFFNRFNVYVGLVMVIFMTIGLAALYTQVMAWMDHSLDFGLIQNSTLSTAKISLATSFTLLILLRYFYVMNQWAHQVEALAKAQMNELQARIKPHFLYNSLNSIASLVAFDPEGAERAVLNLSGLFRKAFADNKNSMSLVAKELEWIEQYMAIEKLRLMDRLTFNIDVDDVLLEQKIPLLSIQPLIENAVIHGIQHLTEGGEINLYIKQTKQGFYVEVTNPVNPKKQKQGTQTGLENIKQRLSLTYGDQVKFEVFPGQKYVVRWEVFQ